VTIRDLTKVGAVLDAVIESGAKLDLRRELCRGRPKPLLVQARDRSRGRRPGPRPMSWPVLNKVQARGQVG